MSMDEKRDILLADHPINDSNLPRNYSNQIDKKSGLQHFKRKRSRLIKSSRFFDSSYYKKKYYSSTNANNLQRTNLKNIENTSYSHKGNRGFESSRIFNTLYRLKNRFIDMVIIKISPALHYYAHGWKEGRDPGPNFSTDGYLSLYPDVRAAGMNPLEHYELHGRSEGRVVISTEGLLVIQTSNLFDSDYYLANYSDVRNSGINPALHYYMYGWKEGRDPSSQFSTNGYLSLYPDVFEMGMNPLEHYELYGKKEGRAKDPLEHYESYGKNKNEGGLLVSPKSELSQSLKNLFEMSEGELDDLYTSGKKEKLRVLVIDALAPSHDQDSGSLRMFRMLQCFRDLDCDVTFIPSTLEFNRYCVDLENLGINVLTKGYIDIMTFIRRYAKSYNLIIVSRLPVAQQFLPLIRECAPKSLLIFDTVDLHFLRLEREDLLHHKQISSETKQIETHEFRLMELSDITLVVSPHELDLIHERRPDLNIQILSNIHEILYSYVPFQHRNGIVFIGGFNHIPNVDAIQFFIRDIYPRIKTKLKDVPIYIVGSNPPEVIKKLASDLVIVTGFIPDVSLFFKTCRLSISPLRYGAGVKGKINMSMAYGLPVVTTSIGAEGMFLENNVNSIIANDPADFADGILDLYSNEKIWNEISINSVKNIEMYFSIDCAKKNILSLIQQAR